MTTGKIAVLFPGQGSQFIGMGREFAKADTEAMAIFEMANAICGKDLQALCFDGPMEELTLAVNLQPAITAVNLTCWQALKKAGVSVDYVAGHSLGEYAALHAANVLSLEDTLRMVAHRGRIMSQAGEKNPGGMVAILGLGLTDVQEILTTLASPESISIANYNSEQQIVLSGSDTALQHATELATAKGGKAVPLNVSIANHSPLMASALPEFTEIFAGVTLSTPSMPILFNVTGNSETDVERIRTIMAQQIVSMVRWYEIINNLLACQVQTFIEVGPKKVLTGLMKRILPRDGGHRCFQLESPETLAQCLDQL